jgi:hypothetical protein
MFEHYPASKHCRPHALLRRGFRMVTASDATENHLLSALPDAELQRWLPLLEPVELPLGLVLYESGRTLSHVYFPTTAIVSLLFVLENGESAEIAVGIRRRRWHLAVHGR